ncbi:MAG: hypothetical protein NC918_08225 [Candidatus Omnitrophica bacterium]|nr:hypothetical protein [Candidatus Omnitrophota bacterium]
MKLAKIIKAAKLLKEFNCLVLAGGCCVPRDLNIEGRNLRGIYFALEYLIQANKKLRSEIIKKDIIDARDKKVVIIGGGDTGNDCLGLANRQ